MNKKTTFAATLLLIFLFALGTATVLAGGFVVVSVDSLPDQVKAGEEVNLSFMVRQHGKSPTHDVTPLLLATNQDTGEVIRVVAQKAEAIGQFTATIVFPEAGNWTWSIDPKPFPPIMELGTLTVSPAPVVETAKSIDTVVSAVPASFAEDQVDAGMDIPTILRWSSLALASVGGLLVFFKRRQAVAKHLETPDMSPGLGD